MNKNQWVITYSNISKSGTIDLLSSYINISGKSALDALYKHFNQKFKRVTGDYGNRYADVILVRGYFDKENNCINYTGRYTCLCYMIDN